MTDLEILEVLHKILIALTDDIKVIQESNKKLLDIKEAKEVK